MTAEPAVIPRLLLGFGHLAEALDMGTTALWRLMKRDPSFPRSVAPAGTQPKWDVDEVKAWIARLKTDRDEGRDADRRRPRVMARRASKKGEAA